MTVIYKQPRSIIFAAPAWDSFATWPCQIFLKKKKKEACVWEQGNTNIRRWNLACFIKFGNTVIVNYVRKETGWNVSTRNHISQHNKYFHTPKTKRIRTLSKQATELLHFSSKCISIRQISLAKTTDFSSKQKSTRFLFEYLLALR